MSQLFTGSICLTDLIDMAKRQHSAYMKAKSNGKIYVNVKIWLNDEPDKFGNSIGLQLNSSKEKKDSEPTFYIGNAKKVEVAAPQPLTNSDISGLDLPDDLPF
jgi:hypothetical protein